MLVNDRDTLETASIKKMSNMIQDKPLLKCMQQCSLRNICKHFLLSDVKNGKIACERTHLVRQYHFNKEKNFISQDPLPKYTLTRRVVIELKEHDGKPHALVNCDCKHIERESQICRHAWHIMNENPTLESFHPRLFKSYPQFMCKNEKHAEIIEKHKGLCHKLGGGMIFDSSSRSK